MSLGINIPIVSQGFDSAQDIVERHNKKLSETKEYVYFSTSNRIDPKKAEDVDYILLSNQYGLRYLCQVVDYIFYVDKGIPVDSVVYSPKKYADVPVKHWFKICSIEIMESEEVRKFIPLNQAVIQKYGNVESYIENTKRLQIFYFKK
ncbi:hypothetical protein BXY41_102475 [Lacrimispora xylanisolvens]|uniref:Uncharacterized protein n=1 Tax=Lacrimispora xylanisolvens TaxID=384636 RepID=A0A2S6HXZ4_9FIRM|nr:hypothetical protein [Hungatella xylanolytica]PPK82785.1 hypothetical protein BXY41_102475 [Hungatella xylanolytica]